jgi:hypothetical protein
MVRAIYQQITYVDPVVYDWPKIRAKKLVLGGDKDGPDFPERAKHIAIQFSTIERMVEPSRAPCAIMVDSLYAREPCCFANFRCRGST